MATSQNAKLGTGVRSIAIRNAVAGSHRLEEAQLLECAARAFCHRAERILGNVDRQTGLFLQEFIETAKEGPTSRQDESSVDEICREFRRTALESYPNGIDNRGDGLEQCFTNFLEEIVIVFGSPATRSRPLTSMLISFSSL